MSVGTFLDELRAHDIHVSLKGDRLHVDAPEDLLTDRLRADLVARKQDIIAFLQASPPPAAAHPRPIRAPRPARPPLSLAQRRLWLLDALDPESTAYTMALALRMRGPVDRRALSAALREIIHRHESLRTRFPADGGEPWQDVTSGADFQVAELDLTTLPAAEREREIARRAEAERETPFDLRNGPLVRATIIGAEAEQTVLLLTLHHIVTDRWSMEILFRELATLYLAFREGQPSPLPPLPIQYADFAADQQEQLRSDTLAPHLDYWKRRLGGPLPVLDLPADRPRPPIRSNRGGHCSASVESALAARIEELGRREQVTPFMVLLAAFAVWLHRVSGHDDILIGSPFTGRTDVETEPLIGFFINTVALRIDLAGDPGFREVVRRVRDAVLDAHTHQAVPFESVVEALGVPTDPSRSPLFQVFFNLFRSPESPSGIPGIETTVAVEPDLSAKFDLTLYVEPTAAAIDLTAAFAADLFDEARVREMLAQYRLVLEQVVDAPDAPVSAVSLVTSAARAVLPDPAVPLDTAWAGTIPGRLTQQAARRPDHAAIDAGRYRWTYAELDRAVKRLAQELRARGVVRGAIVAVLAARDPTLLLALLATLEAGAAFVVLDPAYPAARLAQILAQADPAALIRLDAAGPLPPELEAVLSERTGPVIRLAAGPDAVRTVAADRDATAVTERIDPDDLAYLAFTSGTTGAPKGIRGTHRPLGHFCEWYRATFDLGPADRVSVLSGLAHDPLLRDLFAPLWTGATVCFPEGSLVETPGHLGRWLRDTSVTVTHLTPPTIELLDDPADAALSLPALRLACVGGDRLSRARLRRLRRLAPNARTVNVYGATETPQVMSSLVVDAATEPAQETLPVGRGIADVQLLVLSPGGRLAGIGETGEIAIRTPYLSAGYHGDPELTARRFVANPYTGIAADRIYRTGDLGRYLPDGTVEFLGRADRQVKIRGFRVELSDVEAALLAVPGTREAVALAETDAGNQPRLIAYLAGDWTVPPTSEAIRRHLTAQLPAYAIPSAVGTLATLPRTPNGKVDLRALPALEPAGAPAERTPPRDATELRLCRLWEATLDLPAVGVHDDFFALGGHSLVAVRLFAMIEQEFGRRLSLAVLLGAPTVAQLADILRGETRQESDGALVPIETRGIRRPFFCVHGIGGNVLNYVDLARELGPEQPFYGLQAIGLDGRTPPLQSIDAMARRYLAEIRAAQPQGPYRLGGGCMGGIIAHTIATQLQQAGERVELLALLDVPAPRQLTWRDRFGRWATRHPILRKPARLANRALVWWQLPADRRWARLRAVFTRPRAETVEPVREARAQEVTRTEVQHANYFAMKSHQTGVFRGRIVHFFSDRPPDGELGDRRLAWADRATEGQEIIPIGGGDSGLMLIRPHVELLGKRLGEVLARSLPSDPASNGRGA